MPPKNRFGRQKILEAAFEIVCRQGFDALTARSVATSLGSSVAPLYGNFSSIEELQEAVVEKIMTLSRSYLTREKGPSVLENMGRASLAFARDYPVLIREMVFKNNPHRSKRDRQDADLVELMAQDPELAGWTQKERQDLLTKLRALQIGLTVMVANGQVPSWYQEGDLERILMESGGELVHAKKHSSSRA